MNFWQFLDKNLDALGMGLAGFGFLCFMAFAIWRNT